MDEIIDDILKNTGSNLSKLEESFYKTVLNHFIDKLDIAEGGKIAFSNKSILAVNQLSAKLGSLDKSLVALGTEIQNNVSKIADASLKDFAKYDTATSDFQKEVKKNIVNKANRSINENISLERSFAELKQRAMALMGRPEGITLSDLRKMLKSEAFDKKIATRYFAAWTQDVYYQYQRSTSNEMRKKLGFRFAIYQGGIIETTRTFCDERNGNVYHEDEIAEMDKLEFDGKLQVGHNCLLDCGGYRCRHRWGWVSDEIAFAMRPELEVKYGKKTEAKAAADIETNTALLKLDSRGKSEDYYKETLKEMFSSLTPAKVIYDPKLTKTEIDFRSSAALGLLKEYNFSSTGKNIIIEFFSTEASYGSVQFGNGGISKINFGSATYDERWQTRNIEQLYSKVDKENLELASVVHEFLHVITNFNYDLKNSKTEKAIFVKSVKALRLKYINELTKAKETKDQSWFETSYLGKYADTNVDEFMAEAFAEYKLNSKPSPIALEAGKLIDKYFKK